MFQKEKASCEICILKLPRHFWEHLSGSLQQQGHCGCLWGHMSPCQHPLPAPGPWTSCSSSGCVFCAFAAFCTCREINRGKIIQVYTNLSSKTCVVATGQSYSLKTWRASKLDKQKGISSGQEGNDFVIPSPSHKLWQSNWFSYPDGSTGNPDYPLFPFRAFSIYRLLFAFRLFLLQRSQQDTDYSMIIFSSNLHFRQLSVSIQLFMPL